MVGEGRPPGDGEPTPWLYGYSGDPGRAGALPVVKVKLLVLQAGDAGQVVGIDETTAVLIQRIKT